MRALPTDLPVRIAFGAALRDPEQDGYLYRYRHGGQPLGTTEGAFFLGGFIASPALQQQGRRVEAMRWFERNLAPTRPPGLLSEEDDVVQRQISGNLPQGFVHAMMLEAAVRLAE